MDSRISAAVKCDDEKKLKKILHGSRVDSMAVLCGLMHATQISSIGCLRVLIESGIDVDAQDLMYEESALMKAARRGHVDAMGYLITAHADVNYMTAARESVLHVAVLNDTVDSIQRLLKEPHLILDPRGSNGVTPLMVAAHAGKFNALEVLLAAGCDMYKTASDGSAALHYSMKPSYHQQGKVNGFRCLQLLLNAYCRPDLRDRSNLTPLFYAVECNNAPAVKLLIKCGCNVEVRSAYTEWGIHSLFALATLRLNMRLAKLIFIGGCCVSDSQWIINQDNLKEYPSAFYDWLCDVLQNPRTLQNLCRISVRKSLGYHPAPKIQCMSLPKRIMDYLLLKDADDLFQYSH